MINKFIIFIFIFMVIQSIGTYIQIKIYKNAVRRLHRTGNIGIGAKKSVLFKNIVIISCNNSSQIVDGEILYGLTFFSSFKKINNIIGHNIYELRDSYFLLPKKEQAKLSGHIQALEALCKYMDKKSNA